MNTSELIYDWNQMDAARLRPAGPVLLNDETLRDGLQSPSVRDPSIAEKIQILHLMEALGINSLDLGLPGAGPRALADCEALAHEIVRHKLKIRANCAARTHENDIRPIADIVQRTGLSIQAATFIGSSPIRRYTEGWTDDFLLETTEKAVKFTVSLGLDAMYVTEDTSRCDPEMVKRLYSTAISCGARAIVICDTAGHATPMGAFALIRFVLEEVVKPSGEKIRVDWHGHCDRGLAVANSMADMPSRAIAVLYKGKQMFPQSHAIAANLGSALVATSRYTEGVPELERALGLQPSSTMVLNNLGVFYAKKARLRAGARLLEPLAVDRAPAAADPGGGGVSAVDAVISRRRPDGRRGAVPARGRRRRDAADTAGEDAGARSSDSGGAKRPNPAGGSASVTAL